MIHSINTKGRPAQFKKHHNRRQMIRHCSDCAGIWLDKKLGYYRTRLKGKKGYLFHRHVWEYENNASLLTGSNVHHIDGNPLNNEPRNLKAMTAAQHSSLERTTDMEGRACLDCMATWTRITENGYMNWIVYLCGFLCLKCYTRRNSSKRRLSLK